MQVYTIKRYTYVNFEIIYKLTDNGLKYSNVPNFP